MHFSTWVAATLAEEAAFSSARNLHLDTWAAARSSESHLHLKVPVSSQARRQPGHGSLEEQPQVGADSAEANRLVAVRLAEADRSSQGLQAETWGRTEESGLEDGMPPAAPPRVNPDLLPK